MAKSYSVNKGPIIGLVVVVLAVVGLLYARSHGLLPEGTKAQDVSGLMSADRDASAAPGSNSSANKCLEIGVVTWGGYVGGQYWNQGFKDNPNSRFHQDGICVNFHLMDDFAASRAAFKAGKMDLMWVTIDAFPTESGGFGEPVGFLFQADWSRGGDAIVSRAGINSAGDLAGKKIVVAEGTPSHTFLLWMLDMAGISLMDVTLVKVNSAADAAPIFKSNQADAAVLWSPDDKSCVDAVKNSKILVSTKQATHIIADGFMVKESTYNKRRDELTKLVRGWLKGAAEINGSDAIKLQAAKILSEGLGSTTVDDSLAAINNTRLATYGDNLEFFGLDSSYTGVTGEALYKKMSVVYGKLNLAKNPPPWEKIAHPDFIQNLGLEKETGMAPEKKVTFTAPTSKTVQAKAIASKPVKVSFATGVSTLDDNAKSIIDMLFVEQAKAFPTSRIRIEGNTDSTGSAENNRRISKERAQAVVSYLVSQHQMDKNRFVVVGNGPDKPLCTEETPACFTKNRRTDFQILEN
ncbi:MAG: phosphate ABC transporter substrate-binding/OmpA family protein [Lentisphaeria bacterium]|jgi:NitT/TauT family transport system substrate-binding protein